MKPVKDIEIQRYEKWHLEKVVNLHEACFTKEDNFSMCLGHAFVYTTYQFFLNDEKSFGFVAICEGRVVGVLLGRLDYYATALNAYRFYAALKGFACHPTLLLSKRIFLQGGKMLMRQIFQKKYKRKVESAPSHQTGRTATLASFCIHPEYRNLRIAESLISHVEELCRRSNMQYLRTGIQRSNVASRFTFRSRGYIEDEVLSSENDLLYYLPLNAKDK